jgi:pyruvate dehydrogenase kinase 2/3/4
LVKQAYGNDIAIPEIKLHGHVEATFPYIVSHLQYIIGELLRNSMQAVIEQAVIKPDQPPADIEVLVCEAPQHVIFRISDQGGGIPREILPHLWSFSKGPRTQLRLKNLSQVPKMAATMHELENADITIEKAVLESDRTTSLGSLTVRPPNLRLGMGLPMSRVYAEYWAGKLELNSMEGYGTDAFLHISKLGNKNEQLSTRASMDAV